MEEVYQSADIFDAMGEAVYIVDIHNYEVLFVNKAIQELFGSAGDVDWGKGHRCYEVLQNRQEPCPFCSIGKLRGNETYEWNFHNEVVDRHFELKDRRIRFQGHDAMLEIAFDVTDREQVRLDQQEALEMERRLLAAIQCLDEPGNLSGQIDCILEEWGSYLHADRTYIFNYVENRVNNTFEWCAPGVSAQKDELQDIDKKYIKRWLPVLERHEAVVVEDVEAIRESNPDEYEIMSRQDIRTYIEAPLVMGGRVIGFIGIDNPPLEKLNHLVPIVLALGYFIGGAMTREKMGAEQRGRNELAIKGASLTVWEFDVKRRRMIISDEDTRRMWQEEFAIKGPVVEGIPDVMLGSLSTERDAAAFKKMYADLEKGEQYVSGSFWFDTVVPGVRRCVRITYYSTYDMDGHPDRAYGVGQDITVQKLSESRYNQTIQDLLAMNPRTLCSFRLNLTRNECSDERGNSAFVRELMRAATADGLFANIVVTVNAGEREAVRKILDRESLLAAFSRGQTKVSCNYRRGAEDGRERWVTTNISMLQNPASGDIEAVAHSIDIDDEKKEEAIVRRIVEEELEAIALIDVKKQLVHFRNVQRGWFVDLDSPAVSCDRLLAMAATVWCGQEDGEDMADLALSHVQAMLESQPVFVLPFTAWSRSGEKLRKLLKCCYVDDRREDILLTVTDITDEYQRHLEQLDQISRALATAEKANKAKSDFLSNVSHDMRTPLNAILGYNLLAQKSRDMAECSGYLDKIGYAGRTLLSLINDTLDLQKIENGTVTLRPEPVSCDEFIRDVVNAVQPMMDEKNIDFILEDERRFDATVNVDRTRLGEIFINLLSNAAKFTPEHGRVTMVLACQKPQDNKVRAQIEVQDDGIGISEAFLPKVFEPFSQERTAETADIGGSGLGLSIVRQLVELMGGTIAVESTLGKGSVFTVCLDLPQTDGEPEAEVEEEARPLASLEGRRVLLCEDNAINREIAMALLKMKGVATDWAGDGQQGLDRFTASEPGTYDAVLMDIRMPVMDGYAAARAIREADHPEAGEIPIIALTADAYFEDVQKSRGAGMNGHVPKPIDPALLFRTLAQCIAEREQKDGAVPGKN